MQRSPAGQTGGAAHPGAHPRHSQSPRREPQSGGQRASPEAGGGRLAEGTKRAPGRRCLTTRAGGPPTVSAARRRARRAGLAPTARRGTPPRVPDPDASPARATSPRRSEVGLLSRWLLWEPRAVGRPGWSQICSQPQAFVPPSAPCSGVPSRPQKQRGRGTQAKGSGVTQAPVLTAYIRSTELLSSVGSPRPPVPVTRVPSPTFHPGPPALAWALPMGGWLC